MLRPTFSGFRRAWRSLAATPVVTIVAIGSIGLGLWATTGVFTVVNALLLRPLPARDPGALVRVGATRRGSGFYAFSYPDYLFLRDHNRTLDGLVAHQPIEVGWRQTGQAEHTWAEIVSANYFDVLGVTMALGRGFTGREDRTSSPVAEVVVNHRFWRDRLGASDGMLGQVLVINGHPFSIVGVAGPSFDGTFVGFRMAMWVPVAAQRFAMPNTDDQLDRRDAAFLMLIGRTAGGEHVDQVRTDLGLLAPEIARLDPRSHEGFGVDVRPAGGAHPLLQDLVPPFLALLGASVGLVLVAACANVAGLLVARGIARRRELAVQLALGAGRRRIIRDLLGESLMLAVMGGLLGLALAYLSARLIRSWQPPTGLTVAVPAFVDSRVFVFASIVTLATAILAGLVPALHASRPDIVAALKGLPSPRESRPRRWRQLFLAVQVTISITLAIGALLLIRGLHGSRTIDPGFNSSDVYTVSFEPRLAGLDEAATRQFHRELVQQVRALPGVQAATLALMIPMADRADDMPVGVTSAPDDRAAHIGYNLIDPGYFTMLEIGLVAGREFSDADGSGAPRVAIVNEEAARRFWPNVDPVGRPLWLRGGPAPATVIAVARTTKYRTLGEAPQPFLYLPYAQHYRPDMVLHVKAPGASAILLSSIRDQIRRLNPDVPATTPAPIVQSMGFSLVPARVAAVVLGGSGAIGLALSAIGIFALVAFSVARRRRDIGIHVALGARPRDVVRLTIFDGLLPAVWGVVAGLAITWVTSRVLTGLLNGVSASDPIAFGTGAVGVLIVSIVAGLAPARQALAVEPAVALRE